MCVVGDPRRPEQDHSEEDEAGAHEKDTYPPETLVGEPRQSHGIPEPFFRFRPHRARNMGRSPRSVEVSGLGTLRYI